jgi:hypothetical protein
MAFGGYGSRGIGGLRGRFQRPQQMMQQRPMGQARPVGLQMQQRNQRFQPMQQPMGQPVGQQFNPQMRQQMLVREQAMQQQAQQQITPEMESQYGALQAQMQKERDMQRANPAIGQSIRSPEEEKLLQTFRTARPPPPQPGMQPSPGWASTFGGPQSGERPLGYAQPPSPPPPSFANAPRPQQQQFSPGPQLGLGGRPDRMIQTPRGQELESSMVGLSPPQQQPTQLQPQPVETISPPDDVWGSPQGTKVDAAAGGAGGPPTSWKMSIEPMAHGGMIPGYQNGGRVLLPYQMNTGGYVPMVYANGGYIPAYGLGGWLKKKAKGLGKLALKAAPIALGAINPALGAGVGALISGIKDNSLKSALMGGMTGYLGGKTLSKGLKAAGMASGRGESLMGGIGSLVRGEGLGEAGGAAFDYLSDPKKIAALYPAMAELAEQQAQESPGGQIPSAYTAQSQAVMPQSSTPGYVAPAQGYSAVPRAEGGLISLPLPEYRRGGRAGRKKRKKAARKGRRQAQRRAAKAARKGRKQIQQRSAPAAQRYGRKQLEQTAPAPAPIVPAVQPVAQQLQESGLVPLTPPPQTYAGMEDGEFDGAPPLPVARPSRPVAPPPIPPPPPPPPPVLPPLPEPLPQTMDEDNEFGETGGPGSSPPPIPTPIVPQIQEQIPQTYAEMEDGESDGVGPGSIYGLNQGPGNNVNFGAEDRFAGREGSLAALPDMPYLDKSYGTEDAEFDEGEQELKDAKEEMGPASIYGLNQGPGNNINFGAEDRFAGRGGLPDLPYVVDEPMYGTEDAEFDEGEQEFKDAKETAEDPAVQAAKAAAAKAAKDAAAAKAAKDAAAAKAAKDAAAAAKAARDAAAKAARDAAAPKPVDPSYRAGLMAETASATGNAPITGYDPFNMPTAGQPSQFDPAYGGLMSRLSGQEKLGPGPAPGGGFGGDPATPLPPLPPPTVIPPPPPPVVPLPSALPFAEGGLVNPSTMRPGSEITGGVSQDILSELHGTPWEGSSERMPPEIEQVAIMALRGEMPAAQAAQLLDEIRKLFPAEVDELTNKIRVTAASEGGADSLVSEGFLPPYPDNGLQGNGAVDDTVAIGPMPTSGYQAGGSTSDFEQAFQKRLAGGGPLPVRALLAGGEYIVNAGDAEAGRQELINAATGIDPGTPPGAAVWDDFVGNING